MEPFTNIQGIADTTVSLWETIRPKSRAVIYAANDKLVFELCNISKKPIYIHYVAGFWKTHWYHRRGFAVFLPDTPCESKRADPLTIPPDRNLRICVPRIELAHFLIKEGVSPGVRLCALFRDERKDEHLSRAYWQTLGEIIEGKAPYPRE